MEQSIEVSWSAALPTHADTANHYLLVELPQTWCALPVQYVSRAFYLPAVSDVPNAPYDWVGLINVAGQICPLRDLARAIGFTNEQRYTLDTIVIYCEWQDRSIAFAAENIIGVRYIDATDIHPTHERAIGPEHAAMGDVMLGTADVDGNATLVVAPSFVESSTQTPQG